MKQNISPKYQMALIKRIDDAIKKEYPDPYESGQYIRKWYVEGDGWNGNYGNFEIVTYPTGEIKINETLHKIDDDTLLKIAVDLGLETPDFIPVVTTFKNEIKSSYKTAYTTFEKAIKQIETDPSLAIGLANSALESIIKEILKSDKITSKPQDGKTLYDLTSEILKEFRLFPNSDMPTEIKTIGSSLLAMNQGIEKLRSERTLLHGKTSEDYIVQEATYAYFVVNSVATIGLFLNAYFLKMFPKQVTTAVDDNDLPF